MVTGRAIDFSGFIEDRVAHWSPRLWWTATVDEFVDRNDGPNLLLVQGSPGTGKTSCLAEAAARLQGAHFFLGRSDQARPEAGGGWSEPIRCAETLGTQLVRLFGDGIVDWQRLGITVKMLIGELRGNAVGADIAYHRALPRGPRHQDIEIEMKARSVGSSAQATGVIFGELAMDASTVMREFVLGPVLRAADRFPRVILVMDGLDEWERVSAPEDLLEMLMGASLPANVKIVASARPGYAGRLPPDRFRIVDLDRRSVDDEVRDYFRQAAKARHCPVDPERLDRLVEAAAGNFLVAHYLAESEGAFEGGQHNTLPRGLEEFYARLLNRLDRDLSREGLRGDIAPLFAVLAAAREPIDLATLSRAAGLPEDLAYDVLKRLQPVLARIDDGRFSVFHASFQDYLLTSGAYGLGPLSGHERLAAAALARAESPAGWTAATGYELGNAVRHSAETSEARRRVEQLLDDCAYVAEKVARIGLPSLDVDLRYAKTVGASVAQLEALRIEASGRLAAAVDAGIGIPELLAACAAGVDDRVRAAGFANLASSATLIPLWSATSHVTRAATGLLLTSAAKSAQLAGGRFLAQTGADGALTVWDLRKRERRPSAVEYPVAEAALQASGEQVWIVTKETGPPHRLVRADLRTGQSLVELELEQEPTVLRIDANGGLLGVGTENGRVYLFESATGRRLARRETGLSRVTALRFGADELAVLTRAGRVFRFDGQDLEGGFIFELPRNHENQRSLFCYSLDFHPATESLVVGRDDGSVWRLSGGAELPEQIAQASAWITSLKCLDDGKILVGDSSGNLGLVDPAGGPLQPIRAHAGEVLLVDLLEGDSELVSVSHKGDARFWRTEDVAEAAFGEAHLAPVLDLAVDAGGERVVSLGRDGSLIEWSSEGRMIQRGYLAPSPDRLALALLPDGSGLVVHSGRVERHDFAEISGDLLSAESREPFVPDRCNSLFRSEDPSVLLVSADGAVALAESLNGLELWNLHSGTREAFHLAEQLAAPNAMSWDGACIVTRPVKQDGFLIRQHSAHPIPWPGPRPLNVASRVDGPAIVCADGDALLLLNLSGARLGAWRLAGEPELSCVSLDGELIAVAGSAGLIEIFHAKRGDRAGAAQVGQRIVALRFDPTGALLVAGDMVGGIHWFAVTTKPEGSK